MRNLSNISIREFQTILVRLGLGRIRMRGGHEAWKREGMARPVIFQTHKDPIPEFIVKNALRNIGITRQEFIDLLEKL